MPMIEIDTNVAEKKITPEVVQEMTVLLSEILSLDPKWFAVIFRPNPLMRWAGTSEPCAVCRLTAIDKINLEENREHAKKLFQFMTSKLAVPEDRMFVLFCKVSSEDVGYKSQLVYDLKKAAK